MAVATEVLIELDLQTGIDPVDPQEIKINKHIATTLKKLFPELPQVTDAIENTIAEKSGNTLLHHNMMHYLTLAYYNHFSVVISPDMIFYTILCELASAIKDKPDAFRFLFTNSGEKIIIMTQTDDPAFLDLDQVIAGVTSNIAVDASIFTTDFSCSTNESRLAIKAAFCDAMSPYFHYMNSRCGIPRIKVLGTQQDWTNLETKIYRMATEVFNQVGDKYLTQYIFGAHETVKKMRTETDPAFWKKMFEIDRCQSGHTDLVKGWITSLFRKGADDFYKYDSHISSVEWTNFETGNEYQLRTGLLYSVINDGTSELDKLFPWLEPQFAHLVINKSMKMNTGQYKEYVNNVLKAEDKKIFLGFFDVLKDEALVIKKGNDAEIQRLYIVGKQFDYWTSHPDPPVDLDFCDDKFEAALESYDNSKYTQEINVVFEKLKKVFDTCQVKRLVLPDWRTNMLYDKSAEMLKLLTGKPSLEELSIKHLSDGVYEALIQLLSHEDCHVKTLNMDMHHQFFADQSEGLANALIKMKHPLKKFKSCLVPEIKLADAIYTLATNGSLTGLCINGSKAEKDVLKRVIEAMMHGRALEEVELPNLEGEKDLFESLAKAWRNNTTLKKVEIHEWSYHEKLLNKVLSLRSLKTLRLRATSDLDFLDATKKLESLELIFEVTPVAAANIAYFLTLDTCQLRVLSLGKTLEPNALIALSGGLAENCSLKTFKCELVEDNDEGIEELMQSLVTQQGLEEVEIKAYSYNPTAQEYFIKFIEESKTIKKLTFTPKYYYKDEDDKPDWHQRERLINAMQNGNTLTSVKLFGVKKKEFKLKAQE